MEVTGLQKKLVSFTRKYKYLILILVFGLILMMLPDKISVDEENTSSTAAIECKNEESVSNQLEKILSEIKGAGKVSVMVTVASGEETVYQTDDRLSGSETSDTADKTTVIVTDEDRNQLGLIKEVKSPKYQGAIVVCDGASDPIVRLAVVEAVSKVTGLGADRISVLSRK